MHVAILLFAGAILMSVAIIISRKNTDALLMSGYIAFFAGSLMSLIGQLQPQVLGSLSLAGGVVTLLASVMLLVTQIMRRMA